MVQERRRWCVWQRYMDSKRFVFLDETGTATNMTRRYGRCAKGQRLVAAAPYGHWKTTTFVAGLRQSGIVAPLVLDGPMNGPTFRAYVEQALAPVLKPGDVVVLDNLPAHKVAGVKEAIASRRASLMYLPPYSPDLNPIDSSSPSSRRCCERHPLEPAMPSGTALDRLSMRSLQLNAKTTSETQDMTPSNVKVL